METNNTHKQFEIIDRYLTNSMSVKEKVDFELKLKHDLNLQKAVEEHRLLIDGIETQALRDKLNVFHKNTTKKNTAKHTNMFIKYAVAASLILFLGISSFLLLNNNPNKKLYAKYFTPDPGLPTVMSATKNYEFYNAMVSYKQGKYEDAIEQWQKLYINKPNNDTLNYFLGIAHLANKNALLAEKFLTTATNNQNSVFIDDAQFYLGLIALKNNDNTKAKSYLKQSKLEKSKEIINQLE